MRLSYRLCMVGRVSACWLAVPAGLGRPARAGHQGRVNSQPAGLRAAGQPNQLASLGWLGWANWLDRASQA